MVLRGFVANSLYSPSTHASDSSLQKNNLTKTMPCGCSSGSAGAQGLSPAGEGYGTVGVGHPRSGSSSGREFPVRWLVPDTLGHAARGTHAQQRVLAGHGQRARLQQMVPVEAERGVLLLLQLLQLLQLLGAGCRRLHLEGHLEAAVVHLEGAFLQGHAGLEAVSPEDLVLRVGGAGLARHSCGKNVAEPCWGTTTRGFQPCITHGPLETALTPSISCPDATAGPRFAQHLQDPRAATPLRPDPSPSLACGFHDALEDDDDLELLPAQGLGRQVPERAAPVDDMTDDLGLHQEQTVLPRVIAQVQLRLFQGDELPLGRLAGLDQLCPDLGIHHVAFPQVPHTEHQAELLVPAGDDAVLAEDEGLGALLGPGDLDEHAANHHGIDHGADDGLCHQQDDALGTVGCHHASAVADGALALHREEQGGHEAVHVLDARLPLGIALVPHVPPQPGIQEVDEAKDQPGDDVAHHEDKEEPAVLEVHNGGEDVREEPLLVLDVAQIHLALAHFCHIALPLPFASLEHGAVLLQELAAPALQPLRGGHGGAAGRALGPR